MSDLNEAKTRKQLIDPQLAKAGWDLDDPDQVRFEISVDGSDPEAWQALQQELLRTGESRASYETDFPSGICDYALYHPDGDILAVVEAKRTSVDPRLARAQTEFYVNEIAKRQGFRPFAFMANGYETQFWDVGEANPRAVAGFFSSEDLRNLLYIRRHKTPLTAAKVNQAIVDRPPKRKPNRRPAPASAKRDPEPRPKAESSRSRRSLRARYRCPRSPTAGLSGQGCCTPA